MPFSGVDSRGNDGRAARRRGEASTCGGSVPGINSVSETGVRSYSGDGDLKFAVMYTCVVRVMSCSSSMIFSSVSSIGLGDI